jgi:hypothetical protein
VQGAAAIPAIMSADDNSPQNIPPAALQEKTSSG